MVEGYAQRAGRHHRQHQHRDICDHSVRGLAGICGAVQPDEHQHHRAREGDRHHQGAGLLRPGGFGLCCARIERAGRHRHGGRAGAGRFSAYIYYAHGGG